MSSGKCCSIPFRDFISYSFRWQWFSCSNCDWWDLSCSQAQINSLSDAGLLGENITILAACTNWPRGMYQTPSYLWIAFALQQNISRFASGALAWWLSGLEADRSSQVEKSCSEYDCLDLHEEYYLFSDTSENCTASYIQYFTGFQQMDS